MENFGSTMVTTIKELGDSFVFEQDAPGNWSDINSTLTSSLPPAAVAQLRLYDIFIPLLGVFIITFNLMIVISSGLVLKTGQQPKSTYLFLGNVAMADLVTGVAVLFGQFYPRQYRDEMSCAIQIGMIVSSTITSVYSVGLIAIDRFLYILYGLHYQRFIYPTRTRLLILLAWIIGLVVGFLPAMGWRGDTDNGRICWFIILAPPALVVLTTVIGVLPILLVIVLYSIILHRALYKVRELKKASTTEGSVGVQGNLRLFRGGNRSVVSVNDMTDDSDLEQKPKGKQCWKCCGGKSTTSTSGQTNTSSSKQPSKWKAIKVVLFTTGSFVITWVPYFIASSMYVHCDPQQTPEFCNNLRIAIASPLAILGFANSLLNPIIYAWWHNGFRETAKRIYRKMFCKTKKQKASARTNRTGNTELDGSRSPDISHANFSSTTSMTASDMETTMTDYENRVTMPANTVTVIETSNRRYRNM